MSDIVERLEAGSAAEHIDNGRVAISLKEWIWVGLLRRDAAEEIRRLRHDRQQDIRDLNRALADLRVAQQMYCRLASHCDITGLEQDAHDIARKMGWKCFDAP